MNEFKIIIDTLGDRDLDKSLKMLDEYKQNVILVNKETQKFNQQFAKGNKAVQDQLKQVNLEISKLEQGSKNATKDQQQQLQALKVKQKELTKETQLYAAAEAAAKEATKKRLTESNGLLDKQKQKLKELRKAAAEATNVSDLEKYNLSIAETSQEIKRLQSRTGDLKDQNNLLNNSYDDIVRKNRQLSAEMRKLPIDDVTGDLARMQREYLKNTDVLKRFDAEMGRHTRNVDDYEGSLNRVIASLKGAGSGFAQGIGAGSGGVGLLGSVGAGAFPQIDAAGVITALEGGSQVIADINKQLRDSQAVTQLSGKSLTDYVGNIRATVKVFDQDFNEVLRATNVLTETFGLSGDESINLINEGLLRGADISQDYLDQISEYSTQFKAAGLEAEQLVAITIKAADKGVFSDKAVDAVKEGTIRLREMTKATKDALDGIGLSGDEIEKQLARGEKSIADIIAEVSAQLGTLKPQSAAVGTAIADIFGGAGEDAGLDFLLTLKDINKEFSDGFGPLSTYQQKQQELLESQQRLDTAMTSLGETFSGFGDTVGIVTNNVLAFFAEQLDEIFSLFTDNEEVLERFNQQIKQTESLEELERQLAAVKQQIEETNPKWYDYFLALGTLGTSALGAIDKQKELVAQADILKKRIEEVKNAVEEEADAVEELTPAQEKQIAAYRRLIDGTRDYKSALTVGEVAELTKAQEKHAKELEKVADAAFRAAKAFKEIEGSGLESTFDAFLAKEPEIATFLGAYEAAFKESFLDPTKTIEEEYDGFVDRMEKQIKKLAETHKEEERERLVNESINTAQDLALSVFVITSGLRDRKLQKLDEQMQAELALVEVNEEAKGKIEERYEKERAKIAKKQAMAERKFALFQIAIQTAIAIAKAVAASPVTFGLPFSAFAAAIGIAQAAAVLAQPIPKYRRGTGERGVAHDTLAYVGEAGRELVEYPTGQMALTPSKTTLTYLPKGSKVKTAEETKKLMYIISEVREEMKASPEVFRNSTHVPQFKTISKTAQQFEKAIKMYAQSNEKAIQQAVEKGLSKLELHQYLPDDKGTRHFIEKGGRRRESLNKRNSYSNRKG